jgi:hypothetical protein
MKTLSPPASTSSPIQLSPTSLPVACKAELLDTGESSDEEPKKYKELRFSVLDDSWIYRFDWDTWQPYLLQFDISESAVDATRFGKTPDESVVMFTDSHYDDRRIGKVVGWEIQEGKVYFTVRVGTSEWAERYLQEIEAGVEPGKSIEVFISQMEETSPAEYEDDPVSRRRKLKTPAKRRAMKYQFSGLSTVTTPAVGTVGFNLSMEEVSQLSDMHKQVIYLEEKLESMSNPEPVSSPPEPAPTSVMVPIQGVQQSLEVTNHELEQAKHRIASLEAELIQQRAERRAAGINAFLMENSNRLTPGMKDFSHMVKSESGDRTMNLSQFMAALPDSLLDWFQTWSKTCFQEQFPVGKRIIPSGEAKQEQAASAVDPVQLASLARKKHKELLEAGTPVTHAEAIDMVIAEHGFVL